MFYLNKVGSLEYINTYVHKFYLDIKKLPPFTLAGFDLTIQKAKNLHSGRQRKPLDLAARIFYISSI
jgi:hypothetical protein